MTKRVSLQEVFDDYLASKKTVKPPERPFSELFRDASIRKLMRASEEDLEAHQANLARETILQTQIERIAREKQVPAKLISKMVQRPQVDMSAIYYANARNEQKAKEFQNSADKIVKEQERNKKKAEKAAAREAERLAKENVIKFDIFSEADDERNSSSSTRGTPVAKRRRTNKASRWPSEGAVGAAEPEGEKPPRNELQSASRQRRIARNDEAAQSKPISPPFQLRRNGTKEHYNHIYKEAGGVMPPDFVPVGGFHTYAAPSITKRLANKSK